MDHESTEPLSRLQVSSLAEAVPELAVPAAGEEQPDLKLVALNEELARELGLDPGWLRSPEGIAFLAGQRGGWALAYAGHQFGQYSPILGDGRAVLLGEVNGKELQAKGTGRTPFSRGGDGRGPLDAMLREYVVSEFMYAAGIPTTRGLAVLSTGRKIQRRLVVPAGISVRVASSHLRVGTFELVRRAGGPEMLQRLTEYAWRRFPGGLQQVVQRQARTVAQWMGVGFVHGVMNTDNCTISGETIDYGPCAFLDRHDPLACFSSIDVQGRYAYGRQPAMLHFNLMRLAECLAEPLEFEAAFDEAFTEVWAEKLGTRGPQAIADFLEKLAAENPDHTDTCAALPGKNVRVIPRNHLVEAAVQEANRGDLDPFRALLKVVTHPYGTPPAGFGPPDEPTDYVTYCGT